MSDGWKIAAIIAIIIAIIELILFSGILLLGWMEIEKEELCLYDICNENPYAEYIDGVCFCYDTDAFGDYVLDKTEIM